MFICSILCTKDQWRQKLDNFEGDRNENFGLTGVTFYLFFSHIFLPPRNFRGGTSPSENFKGRHVPVPPLTPHVLNLVIQHATSHSKPARIMSFFLQNRKHEVDFFSIEDSFRLNLSQRCSDRFSINL